MDAQPEMMQVTGRLLPPPCLAYGGEKHMNPGSKGAWDLRGVKWVVNLVMGVLACMPDTNRSGTERVLAD
jgi:hypothetical protein